MADIRAEWEDRYGPVPPQADALLAVATLRAECVRTGVREVTVTKGPGFGGPKYLARVAPLALPASKLIRLQRLYKRHRLQGGQRPAAAAGAAAADSVTTVIAALRELVPEPEVA